jgi:uncharacterized protein YbjT (DUF2867 family)
VALLSSSAAPSGDRTNVIARFNIEAEELVRGSGHPWTIVRPNAFMSNALRWKPRLDRGDLVRGPWGHSGRDDRSRGRRRDHRDRPDPGRPRRRHAGDFASP